MQSQGQRTAVVWIAGDSRWAGPRVLSTGSPPLWPASPASALCPSPWLCLQPPVGLTSLWGSPAAEKIGIF